ncbi:MAG: LytTR family transcriptional regulator [Flavobacteriales bacterium]|nr:LytTR family transcriptional regulator [Flavobacteriales bacterium]
MVNPILALVISSENDFYTAVESLKIELDIYMAAATTNSVAALTSMLKDPADVLVLDAREELSMEVVDLVRDLKNIRGIPMVVIGKAPAAVRTYLSRFDQVIPLKDNRDLAESIGKAIVDFNGMVRKDPNITHYQLYTKVGNKLKRINIEEIRYIEVEGKYCSLKVGSKRYNVKVSLKDLIARLRDPRFVRVSRNFVINMEEIEYIDTFNFSVKIDEREIPISRTYKDQLMGRIELI